MTVFIVASLAAAKTSAGAPLTICWARSDEPAKLNLTVTPGWSVSNCLPSAVNVSVSDAAAEHGERLRGGGGRGRGRGRRAGAAPPHR